MNPSDPLLPTVEHVVQTQYLFVDEAGDPTLFTKKGVPLLDTNGCSRFFIVGKLDVEDPPSLAKALTDLRIELGKDSYFAGEESFRPEREKTALFFHATDDLPEVRYLVYRLLRSAGESLRFHAVVCDKSKLLLQETEKRRNEPRYRYQPDTIYDGLMRSLFSKFHILADRYDLCVARRGNRDRNQAIEAAIAHAEREFKNNFGFARTEPGGWNISISDPTKTVCLQAVDYFLWAVQRFYEIRIDRSGQEKHEDRYLSMLWPQIGEIHDQNFGPKWGTHWTDANPLTLDARFGEPAKKKKKS